MQILAVLEEKASSDCEQTRKLSVKAMQALVEAAPEKAAAHVHGLVDCLLRCCSNASREVSPLLPSACPMLSKYGMPRL